MQQQPCSFTSISAGRSLPYLLALPDAYADGTTDGWPLLLFLHGRGERGHDLEMLKRHGIPQVLTTIDDFPLITVSPQCPDDLTWEDLDGVLIELLDDLARRYPIDPQQIFLTGLSMGGRGAWRLAVLHPQHFAALVPICGRIPDLPNFLERVVVLKDLPIWVFHGAQDQVVPLENSQKIVAALTAVGSDVRFTVYPDADHDAWTKTYTNPALYEWLFQEK